MKSRLLRVICLCSFVALALCACGKKGNPIKLPDRDNVVSIGVEDGEKYAFSPNTEGEAAAVQDVIPMVRVGGRLYYDTGEVYDELKCGVMDGEITSSVAQSEIPAEDNQSNFGSGFGYQYGDENSIVVYVNDKRDVFEYRAE